MDLEKLSREVAAILIGRRRFEFAPVVLEALRFVADQARREALEEAAKASCHICRMLTDEVVIGKFGPAIERGPKGNWDHPCLTSVEEFYATCMASPVRALATEDKEGVSLVSTK